MKSQEFSRRALSLSLAIYRITAKFPAGEALAAQLRLLGNEIAGDLAEGKFTDLKKKISRLRIYFAIAKAQNWVKLINWSILDFEYYKLQTEALFDLAKGPLRPIEDEASERREKELEEPKNNIMSHNIKGSAKALPSKSVSVAQLKSNSRQSRISALLGRSGPLKMSALIPLFKDEISERTLRNELQGMIRAGLIKKNGVNKFTEYYKGDSYRQFIGKTIADKNQ